MIQELRKGQKLYFEGLKHNLFTVSHVYFQGGRWKAQILTDHGYLTTITDEDQYEPIEA